MWICSTKKISEPARSHQFIDYSSSDFKWYTVILSVARCNRGKIFDSLRERDLNRKRSEDFIHGGDSAPRETSNVRTAETRVETLSVQCSVENRKSFQWSIYIEGFHIKEHKLGLTPPLCVLELLDPLLVKKNPAQEISSVKPFRYSEFFKWNYCRFWQIFPGDNPKYIYCERVCANIDEYEYHMIHSRPIIYTSSFEKFGCGSQKRNWWTRVIFERLQWCHGPETSKLTRKKARYIKCANWAPIFFLFSMIKFLNYNWLRIRRMECYDFGVKIYYAEFWLQDEQRWWA